MDVARSCTNHGLTTEVFTEESVFDLLRREWDALLDTSKQQVYFLRHQWNQLWWRHYAPKDSRLYIVTCRDKNGALIGLAPFYWKQHRLFGFPHARELLFLGMGIELKSSEYLNIVARQGDEEIVATAIASCLKTRLDWDRIWMEQVPSGSVTLPHFVTALGAHTTRTACDRAPYIDTSVDWQSFKNSLGRSMRRNVEYYGRRLFKRYQCEFHRSRTIEELETALDSLVRLHQARWQSAGELGSFTAPELELFLRQLIRGSLPAGQIRFWTLTINGTVEAALLGFLDNGVLHYFQKGFNPAYAKEDVGTAMLGLCLRDCFDDPEIRAFDFMGGGAAYKKMWARLSSETTLYEMKRLNLRTHVFTLRAQIFKGCAAIYRTLTPNRIRAMRRDLMRRIKVKRNTATGALIQLGMLNLCVTAELFELSFL